MSDVVFVQELYSLICWVARTTTVRRRATHLAKLAKERHKFTICLHRWVIKRARSRVHHDLGLVRKFYHIK